MKLLYALLILCVVLSQKPDEDGIIELNSKNFHKVINSKGYLFLFFHSPWDSRSKAFEYDFRRIGREIKEEELDIKLAKINLPANRDIAEIYHIRNFPALYFYEDGKDELYTGDLKVDKIMFYLKKKVLDPFTRVNDDLEIASHLKKGIAVAIAHFSNDQSLRYKHFVSAIRENESTDILIAIGDVPVSQPLDSFSVYNIDEQRLQFDGKWSVDEIRQFVALASMPLIVPYTSVWSPRIFSSDHHVREHLLYMSDDQELLRNRALQKTLSRVAKAAFGRFLVLDVNADERDMIHYFGFEREQLPILFYVDLRPKTGSIKYVFHEEDYGDEYTEEGILEFAKKAHQGELYPFYKSERPYAELDGFVKRLVSRDFADVAFDPYTNVLVEFVVPECRLCKKIEDDYQHLAHDYLNAEDVVIARVDSSKNEIKDFVPPDFPAIYLYQAGGDGEKSVHLSNEQLSYSQMKDFVEKNRVVVNKPKRVEKVKEEEVKEEEVTEEVKEEVKEEEVKEEEVKTEEEVKEEVEEEVKEEVKVEEEEKSQTEAAALEEEDL